MDPNYNIPFFRAPIVSGTTAVSFDVGPPAIGLAPRDGYPYPEMRLAPVQQGSGIQPELFRFAAVMDNNNTYTIDIGRAGTVVHAIDDVVVAVTASNQVTNWVVEYNANRSGYTIKKQGTDDVWTVNTNASGNVTLKPADAGNDNQLFRFDAE